MGGCGPWRAPAKACWASDECRRCIRRRAVVVCLDKTKDGSTGPSQGARQPTVGGVGVSAGWNAQTWSLPTRGPNHQPENAAPSRVSQ